MSRLGILGVLAFCCPACAPTGGTRLGPPIASVETSAQRGAAVFASNGCGACHRPNGIKLTGMNRHTDDDLAAIFETPPTGMPVVELSIDNRSALFAYLRTAFP